MGTEAVSVRSHPGFRLALRALGNLLLGAALGLLAYYFVTDMVTSSQQSSLLESAAELGTMGATSPDRMLDEPEPGYTGWETWFEEDVAYWRALEEQGVFGRLVIERMDLDVVVVRGVDREALKMGPGWMPYTDVPQEQRGNVGIAAHRTTYGAHFRRLDEMQPGDIIHFYSPYRRYTYEVEETLVVTPDEIDIVRSTEDPMLTLSACHPLYSAAYRLIVRSKLVEMSVLEETPASGGS